MSKTKNEPRNPAVLSTDGLEACGQRAERMEMEPIERLAREHGTGGWQTLEDMILFGKAVAEAAARNLEEEAEYGCPCTEDERLTWENADVLREWAGLPKRNDKDSNAALTGDGQKT